MNELQKAFADADRRKRAAAIEDKEAKAIMDELAPQILEQMALDGEPRFCAYGITYSPTRRLFVGPDSSVEANKAVVAQALVASGLGDYVKPDYNANSLSAYVRAVAEEHGGRDTMTTSELRSLLPEPLAAVLKVADEWTIGSSKH